MKQYSFKLSLLISSNHGQDVDVYLQPIMEELNGLWEVGLETYDAEKRNLYGMQLHCLISSYKY